MKFDEISTAQELITHLCDYNSRLQNINILSQYTRLSAITGIMNSGYWIMNNPKSMNDLFEYKMFNDHSSNSVWNGVFFASFTPEENENVAMWSMYGQPWEDGIRVSIPKDCFKEWVSAIDYIYSADPITKKVDTAKKIPKSQFKVSIVRVAYNDQNSKALRIANNTNTKMLNPYASAELAGYIKDSAWAYEREIRLRVDLPADSPFECIAVKVPNSVLSRIEILKGPRYCGRDVLMSLPNKFRHVVNIASSDFSDKIGWIPCDNCTSKNDSESASNIEKSEMTKNHISHIYSKGHAIASFEHCLKSSSTIELRILGFSAEGFLHTYRSELTQFIRSGKNMKILLASPESLFVQQASEMEGRSKDAISHSIYSAVELLEAIKTDASRMDSAGCGSIEIKHYDTEIRNQVLICIDKCGNSFAWLTVLIPPLSATNCKMIEFSDANECNNYFTTIWERH